MISLVYRFKIAILTYFMNVIIKTVNIIGNITIVVAHNLLVITVYYYNIISIVRVVAVIVVVVVANIHRVRDILDIGYYGVLTNYRRYKMTIIIALMQLCKMFLLLLPKIPCHLLGLKYIYWHSSLFCLRLLCYK